MFFFHHTHKGNYIQFSWINWYNLFSSEALRRCIFQIKHQVPPMKTQFEPYRTSSPKRGSGESNDFYNATQNFNSSS